MGINLGFGENDGWVSTQSNGVGNGDVVPAMAKAKGASGSSGQRVSKRFSASSKGRDKSMSVDGVRGGLPSSWL